MTWTGHFGCLFLFWRCASASEIMQRIAAPMVGGMLTAPLLSMFVIPAAYKLMRRPTPVKVVDGAAANSATTTDMRPPAPDSSRA